MYAVVKKKREPGAEITTVGVPKIKENEVLVKVKMASICGTDVHVWNWGRWAQDRIKKLPLILGHELAGIIVEVGEDVTNLVKGDMVSAETHIVDGTCYQCRTGHMHVCQNIQLLGVDRDGAFAQFVVLPERNAWKNDPQLDLEVASLQEPLGNAVHAIFPEDHIEDISDKSVAVLGCGPVGLMAVAVLKELGAAKVFATAGGQNKVRMRLAEKMGADLVLSAKEHGDDIIKIILDETGGSGVHVSLEMSGAASAVRQAFEILAPGGRVSLLGFQEKPVIFDWDRWVTLKSATVYGISGRRMFQTWHQVRNLISSTDLRKKIASIVTHRIPIRNIEKGIDLINSKQVGKVVLEPNW